MGSPHLPGHPAEPAARFSNGNALRYWDDAHPRQRFLTPGYVLEPVRQALGGVIGLDPCTEPDNPTGAVDFYCPPVDGAAQSWSAPAVFVNPPYSWPGNAGSTGVSRRRRPGRR